MVDETGKIQFHEGFYGAIKVLYTLMKIKLTFLQEQELGNEPVRLDMLIIKHKTDEVLEDDIGRFFKEYNIIEYKSPSDRLTVDEFYKAQGYALLYKGLNRKVDEIPIKNLTVSIFRHSYPGKMFKTLMQNGLHVAEKYPGVYYVTGASSVQTQVVVMSRLKADIYQPFKLLAKGFNRKDVEDFLTKTREENDPICMEHMKAILNVAIAIDESVFDEIKKEGNEMSEAVERLFKEEFAECRAQGRSEGIAQGRTEGIAQGRSEERLNSVRNLMSTMKLTVDRAMEALSIPDSERAELRVALAQE